MICSGDMVIQADDAIIIGGQIDPGGAGVNFGRLAGSPAT